MHYLDVARPAHWFHKTSAASRTFNGRVDARSIAASRSSLSHRSPFPNNLRGTGHSLPTDLRTHQLIAHRHRPPPSPPALGVAKNRGLGDIGSLGFRQRTCRRGRRVEEISAVWRRSAHATPCWSHFAREHRGQGGHTCQQRYFCIPNVSPNRRPPGTTAQFRSDRRSSLRSGIIDSACEQCGMTHDIDALRILMARQALFGIRTPFRVALQIFRELQARRACVWHRGRPSGPSNSLAGSVFDVAFGLPDVSQSLMDHLTGPGALEPRSAVALDDCTKVRNRSGDFAGTGASAVGEPIDEASLAARAASPAGQGRTPHAIPSSPAAARRPNVRATRCTCPSAPAACCSANRLIRRGASTRLSRGLR